MSDSVILAIITAALSFAGSWAAVKVELRSMRHSINAAHRRLDRMNAPAAGVDALPD